MTHQEPEHGEAWANLSALWLQEGGWREALHAAEQAVKLKRDSWQTWDNYALAAAQAQAATSCVRGLAEVRAAGIRLLRTFGYKILALLRANINSNHAMSVPVPTS